MAETKLDEFFADVKQRREQQLSPLPNPDGILMEWKGYTAGMIDGEGCFQILKQKPRNSPRPAHQARLTVANTNLEALQFLKRLWGGAILAKPLQIHDGKRVWLWITQGRRLEIILDALSLYLVIKQKQAESIRCFLSEKRAGVKGRRLTTEIIERREMYRHLVKKFNDSGRKARIA